MTRRLRTLKCWSILLFAAIILLSHTAQAKYSGGTGEPDDPYQIGSAADLLALAADTDDYSKSFILIADINLDPNLPGNLTFTTAVIGQDSDNTDCYFDGYVFTGIFDGAGYKISNLTINTGGVGNDYLGLFGYIYSGEIKNLRIENVNITGGDGSGFFGGLTGNNFGSIRNCTLTGIIKGGFDSYEIGGLAGDNYGNISNCSSTATVMSDAISAYIGGLVGYQYEGNINKSYSSGYVRVGNDSWYLGGLLGYNCFGDINDCYSTSNVIADSNSYVIGGLVGENGANIINSYSTGDVCSTNNLHSLFYIGGLAGSNHNDGNIINSYSTSRVSVGNNSHVLGGLTGDNDGNIINSYSTGIVTAGINSNDLGGLAGDNKGGIINCYSKGNVTGGINTWYLGGLVGFNYQGRIIDCCSTALVTGGDNAGYFGGLVGYNSIGTIRNSYSKSDISNGNNSSNIGGLVGENGGGIISDCFSTGDITGGESLNFVGGFAGSNNGNINNSYSTGIIYDRSDWSYIGGLVGYNFDWPIINSSYFLNTSGPDNDYGEPLTDEQMKQQASFIGWDFVGETANGYGNIWRLCNEGLEFPNLAWQYLSGDIVCPDGVDIEDLAELCEQWLLEEIPADLAPSGGDGTVNLADFAIFANQWVVRKDTYDLLDFANQWLKIGLPNCSADTSPLHVGDGRVNVSDLAVLAENWLL